MFWRHKDSAKDSGIEIFDITGKVPAIRQSICTGEKVAGFRDIKSGRFEEVLLIKSERDVEYFMAKYGIKERGEIKTFY